MNPIKFLALADDQGFVLFSRNISEIKRCWTKNFKIHFVELRPAIDFKNPVCFARIGRDYNIINVYPTLMNLVSEQDCDNTDDETLAMKIESLLHWDKPETLPKDEILMMSLNNKMVNQKLGVDYGNVH